MPTRLVASPALITTAAGTGESDLNGDGIDATAANLSLPIRVTVDPHTRDLLIADRLAHPVRRVSAETESITTVAGTGVPGYNGDDMPATAAQLR